MFTPQQIANLLQIIDRYTLTFIAHKVSPAVLTNDQRTVLSSYGINLSNINSNNLTTTQAFKFGLLSSVLDDNVVRSMTYNQLTKYLKSGKMFKLNALERAALNNVQYQTYRDINKLSNKIKDDISDILVRADKANHTVKHHKIVTDAAKNAIENRKSINSVVSEIGHRTELWNRDLGRIADFVMHTAFDEGRAFGIIKEGGDDALVYKDVYPGACKHCISHYLTAGAGSAPKIFKISELKANGTNVGRKVTEYKPVIGPLHPWCRCTLMSVPRGFTIEDYSKGLWMWDGRQFIRDKSKFVRKVNRRSKVGVTVNGKTTTI